MNLLHVNELKKSYARGFIPRQVPVLHGLTFSIPAGSVTGFLGANGAGKTTALRCVLGLDFPDSGTVEFFGSKLSVESRARIGFLPERPYFYEHLTGVEFLQFQARLTRSWKKVELQERILKLLRKMDLEFAKDRPLRTYSKGMLQKIGVAQALIHEPEVIILDEPMSGLDPDGRMALAEIISETAKAGPAIFFSSHLLHDMERLCSRLIVLKNGVSVYEGPLDSLLERGGGAFEIVFIQAGRPGTKVVAATALQEELQRLLTAGSEVVEVRCQRFTLEEIFVRMASREVNP